MLIAALALTLGASAQLDSPAIEVVQTSGDLAVAPLLARRHDEAIAVLEQSRIKAPHDPAVLINLGVAYAQIGKDDAARALFSEARTKRAAFDVATSDGRVTDPGLVARRAIRMLAQGEFRTNRHAASQLTLRN